MPHKQTLFEREAIYKQVWDEPVRTVASRYDISDVGLRKICKKLGVPIPPLGYWAKRAAGKSTRITPLPVNHKGDTRYVRSVWIDEEEPERDARVRTLLAERRPATWPEVVVPAVLLESHAVVARTAKRLGTSTTKRILDASGKDVFTVSISPAQMDRALRVLDGIVKATLSAGGILVPAKPEGPPLHFEVLGQFVGVQLEELFDRTFREPTPKEVAEQAKYEWRKPDLRVYTPNGKIKLTVLSANRYVPLLTISDGMRSPIEERLTDLVERIWAKAAGLNIQAQMRDEEHQRWEERRRKREALEAVRREQLGCLEDVEKVMEKWERARRLRRFADALEVTGKAITHGEVVADSAWIRNAADWLDPLRAKDWALVDGEPET